MSVIYGAPGIYRVFLWDQYDITFAVWYVVEFKQWLVNVAIANALQLEAARATSALSRFNYDAMPSLKWLNLSIAVL